MYRFRSCLCITALSGFAFVFFPLLAQSPPKPARGLSLASLANRFPDTVHPFLKSYCTTCHSGAKPKGDLDLTRFTTAEAVSRDLRSWQAVLEQLDAGTMPPKKAKAHPPAELRREVVAWIRAMRTQEANRNAGDPGPVPARRLSNAEYDYTIRDLTGVDSRPAREFPVDPANEAGFDNSAESLTLSPELLDKYLEAARKVAEHIVFQTDGFVFAPYSVVADTDRDKFCVRRIIDFYKRQPTDYADYFQAAWHYQHRAALGQPDAILADSARMSKVSPKYLVTVWSILTGLPEDTGPIAALRVLWNDLPGPEKKDAVRPGCEQMRDLVTRLREQLVPKVRNLTAPRMQSGAQPLVLWKDRQMEANRLRYAGGAPQLSLEELAVPPAAACALEVPIDPAALARYEADLTAFCAAFPDAFYISERARVYLDPEKEKKLGGRLLSAGFHSMTGYYRDDGPLYELVLSREEQRELDRLWLEFDMITGVPVRQYTSFIWFERTDSSFMRGEEFAFARAEDKDSTSDAKIGQLAEVYIAKARRSGASAVALAAAKDHFEIAAANIRQAERTLRAAEPKHLDALQAFAERAYRRPLTPAERADIVTFYRESRDKEGLTQEEAIRDGIISVLMSPNFLFRAQPSSLGAGISPLPDYSLASRLSYFLWATMPDAELLSCAAAGNLHRPEVLLAQARRLVRDERVRGLATEFAGNWLDFRRFEEHNAVDRDRFKSFNDELRRAMFEEPLRFVIDVARADRSVLDFLYGDYTFVNPALARHYGMPVPSGGPDQWVRIDDVHDYGRGGLLPMGVFLTKNAPGLRTSPVKRGYWVVRRLLGEKVPAPPSEVPELPADEAKLGELTLREVLARHRADKSCAGCHERFDGIGLAFEGYGPVGELRKVDLGGRRVDTRVVFPGGDEGTGLDGLRAYLKECRQDEFLDNLCRKLLAYALGRTLLPSDDILVHAMRQKLIATDYRFSTLVEAIITSPQFLNQRGGGQAAR